ncbi:hypothetical protein [Meiothermus sp.]
MSANLEFSDGFKFGLGYMTAALVALGVVAVLGAVLGVAAGGKQQ